MVGIAIGIAIGSSFKKVKTDKYSQLLEIISRDYVDSLNKNELEQSHFEMILSNLDPHSSYIPKENKLQAERIIDGEFEGIGVEFVFFYNELIVFNIVNSSNAEIKGLKIGDRVLSINDIKIIDTFTIKKISNLIANCESSKINFLIKRNQKVINLEIEKSTVNINSSEVYYMINNEVGYIKLERFSQNSYSEFMMAAKQLQNQGMKSLILDLRNNGGGLLNESVKIANEFLKKGELIAYTKGYNRADKKYKADGKGLFKNIKLAVYINKNTASASEILSGALQDNDRAVLIGQRSFGKGLVQEPFYLLDGSLVRLTIARYYTPSGRSIQKLYNKNVEIYKDEVKKRNTLKDTLNPIFLKDLNKNYFTKNGRLLVTNGGIRPDIINIDTIMDSLNVYKNLPQLRTNYFIEIYVIDFLIDKYKNKYVNISEFNQKFSLTDAEINQFIDWVNKLQKNEKIKYNSLNKNIINHLFKYELAYRLFGENGLSIMDNQIIFSKTFQVLKNYNSILNPAIKKRSKFDY